MIGRIPNACHDKPNVMGTEPREDAPERLDVREIDGEPFDDIMNAIEALDADETLRLINDFEPTPLYGVLDARGFQYEASEVDEGVWHIDIEHA